MSELLTTEIENNVAVITLDDGKANALSFAMLEAINKALDDAMKHAQATVLMGRPGIMSGGFDLKVIKGGNDAEINRLAEEGVRVLMRLYGHSQPLVVAATGHAVALGAFMLLTGDYRIGTRGDFKIGLNETAIGLVLPSFGIELANARLSPRYLTRSAISSELFDSEKAIDVGFLDQISDEKDVRQKAIEKAEELSSLDANAFSGNKSAFRQQTIERVLGSLGR
jgi:enoyl-CoA hydratase